MDPKQIREKRAQVWAQMQAILTRSAENLTAEDRQEWDRLEAELAALSGDLERAERAAVLAVVDYSGVIDSRSTTSDASTAEDTDADYRTAFELYVRYGSEELNREQRGVLRSGAMSEDTRRELRAQGVGTSAAGGYTVPPEFWNKLVETMKFYSGMRQVAEGIATDTGASLPWMTNNDTANVGAILAENTAVTEQDLTFGTISLDVFMYTSKMVRVSLQLIQDSAVSIDDFLPRKLGERIGRIQNQHFTTGTGTAQPLGLITGGNAVQAAAASANVTSYSYETLVDATMRLDPAYLMGGNLRWMASQAAIAAIRKLKDGNGLPLWQPSVQVGAPDSLLGYGIVLNNDMAVPAANAKSLAFGDFKAGYVIRDARGVQTLRLTERYADFLQVGFLSFARSGGTVQDTSSYTVVQNAAT